LKNCLIISPYFPPSTLAGVHRARHLAKHLPAAGWWPIIICVDEAYHEQRLDLELSGLVPSSVEIVKISAIPAKFTRPFGVGEISLRAGQQLRRTVFHLIQSRDIKAVLITGSPYYPMLLAPEITRRFNVPVILDFQDPWVSAAGDKYRLLSKPGLSHWLAKTLEPRALDGAAYVTSVSDVQNAEMAARYPWLDRARMAAIPIGGDPEDFDLIRSRDSQQKGSPLSFGESDFALSYAGTIWPPVIPALKTLLRAARLLKENASNIYGCLKLRFVGSTADPDNTRDFMVKPLAEAEGVDDVVQEIPQRIPYLDALRVMARTTAGLMIGSDEPHYTASKLYPVLMAGRPYISLFHRDSSAHHVLTKAGGGIALSFGNADELKQVEQPLAEAIAKLVKGPDSLGRTDPSAYAPFEARMIAKRFAEVFDEAIRVTGCRGQRSHRAASHGDLS
jgi:glycosyltransferase involved in cell wall biosynthesis